MCHELKERLEVDLDLFLKIITGDKSQCHETQKYGRGEEKNDGSIVKPHFVKLPARLETVETAFGPMH